MRNSTPLFLLHVLFLFRMRFLLRVRLLFLCSLLCSLLRRALFLLAESCTIRGDHALSCGTLSGGPFGHS